MPLPEKRSNAPETRDSRRRPRSFSPDRLETARYIAALTAEMSGMAKRADLPLLSYFLEMARLEAAAAASPERRAGRATPERRPLDPEA